MPNMWTKEKKVAYDRATKQRRRKMGLCVHCGRPSRGTKRICALCKEKAAVRRIRNRLNMKCRAVAYLGGVCSVCKLKDSNPAVYDFHHIDPTTKDGELAMKISSGQPWERIQPELDKCMLVCSNCHRRLEYTEGECVA